MPLLRFAAVLSVTALFGGCLNSGTIVRLKPDGSGTVEQTLLFNMAAAKMMMPGMQSQTTQGGVLNEAEMKAAAAKMGEGVRFVSATPLKEGTFEGAKAIFAFDDINKIRVDQDPSVAGSSTGTFAAQSKPSNPLTFKHTRAGGNSVLTISLDEGAARAPAGADAAAAGKGLENLDPAMMEMVKSMFKGFHVNIALEIDGKIVKTNADYVEGSRITLLDIDMDALLQDPTALQALQGKAKPGATLSELRPFLKSLKGVRINNPQLTIEYR